MSSIPAERGPDVAVPRPSFVLIVDDSADARALYGEYLEFCGFRVATARDGMEAVFQAQQDVPDIIIMDLSMPRLDGWEAIRQLKAHPRTAGIPVIAVSAYANREAVERVREAGAEVCLSKPCLPSQVARAIRALLVWRRSATT
jgi:CheY-like chemotaxis protein